MKALNEAWQALCLLEGEVTNKERGTAVGIAPELLLRHAECEVASTARVGKASLEHVMDA